MSGNAQKKPFVNSLSRATQLRIADALQELGQALPCSLVSKTGSIATVKFEITDRVLTLPQVRVPIAGSEYVRLPLQPGCKGVVFPADARLGGVSGLGGGTASLAQPANLTALVFFPIGNVNFSAVDGDKLVLYGEPNVLIKDKTGASVIELSTSSITLSSHGHSIVINTTGVIIDGKNFLNHTHGGVQSGSSNTTGVT